MKNSTLRKAIQSGVFSLLRLSVLINAMALAIIVYFLVINGAHVITWEFLTQKPFDSMTQGGIMPCIVGTMLLSFGAMAIAFPLGVSSAIYLHEYARPGKLLRFIRFAINNLAGVPSVVFGLFGLAFFVTWMGFGVSILSGILTLGFLILPVIIGTSEEALRS
ncbi:MAG: phosphate ABC transporter, permease protein PstA, partial [Desulfoplanes sp.]